MCKLDYSGTQFIWSLNNQKLIWISVLFCFHHPYVIQLYLQIFYCNWYLKGENKMLVCFVIPGHVDSVCLSSHSAGFQKEVDKDTDKDISIPTDCLRNITKNSTIDITS